jgi:hypothetical protein
MKEFAVGFAVLLFTLRHYHGYGERSGHKLEVGYANQCPTSSCTCVQVPVPRWAT